MSSYHAALQRVRALPIGYLYVLIAVLCAGLASVFTKGVLTAGTPPVPLLATRLILSAALLWVIMVFVFRQRIPLERRLIVWGIAAGLCNAVSLTAFYMGLMEMDASVAMVLFSTNPLVVLALLALIGIRPRPIDGVRAGLALCGVLLLVGIGGQVSLRGVAWIMVTVMMYSLHMIIVQRRLHGYNSAQIAPLFITVMAVCVGGLHFLTSAPAAWFSFTPQAWLVIAFTAVFSTVIARLALIAGIQRIGSGQTALFSPLETVIAVMFAALFLHERLTALQMVGGALVLLSAGLVLWRTPPPVSPAGG
jgi:drug/metabolite transporter (DMT)-like permease